MMGKQLVFLPLQLEVNLYLLERIWPKNVNLETPFANTSQRVVRTKVTHDLVTV